MRRVARRPGGFDFVSNDLEPIALVENMHPPGRYRTNLAPQELHVVEIQPRRAREQTARIRHVRRALRVHEYARVRATIHQDAGRPRVIEMDVRQENRAHVTKRHALCRQLPLQRLERRRRSWVDERDAVAAVQDAGGNDLRLTEKVDIDVVETRG